ncbi:MAG: hypothetical protein J7K95_00225 [Thermoplasmata archaeon]|nr:hypothetical protein [Thermoplasmata archaeon]
MVRFEKSQFDVFLLIFSIIIHFYAITAAKQTILSKNLLFWAFAITKYRLKNGKSVSAYQYIKLKGKIFL